MSRFHPTTGRASGTAEAAEKMWKRMLFLPALALAIGMCKTPALADAAITGIGDVRVVAVRFVPDYVLTTLELTNDSAHDFTPDIGRFILTAPRNERYIASESGSSVFAGVSNPHRTLKHGDTRIYTVGFRTPDPVAAGTVSYEP
jgi:hypothetical protein